MPSPVRRRSAPVSQVLERLLRSGPRSAEQLMHALEVRQPALSRTIRDMPSSSVTSFRVKGQRTPLYALLRPLPLGLNPRQRIYRQRGQGHIETFADVEFLAGGATLERVGGVARLYEGLPPYVLFAAPSGFLGRQLALKAADTHMRAFPNSLKDWGDDHKVAYLFTQGLNLPGNLIFGDAPLEHEMAFQRLLPSTASAKRDHYVEMARAMRDAAYGSSAGGEQPKFLWFTEDSGHVIVKFARTGTRMADLLPLEHLALRALAHANVPATPTQLLASPDFVFLEIQRFDRIGRTGRIGMLSAGAVDDEFFGQCDTWPEFAARCEQARYLGSEDARRVDVMAAFSELIGNSDRHFENLSLLIGEDGEYAGIAPAYDILPMRYAPIGGGVDPTLAPIEPKVGTVGARPDVWRRAAVAADLFWRAAATEELPAPISREMRALAQANRVVARDFVAPLLPRD